MFMPNLANQLSSFVPQFLKQCPSQVASHLRLEPASQLTTGPMCTNSFSLRANFNERNINLERHTEKQLVRADAATAAIPMSRAALARFGIACENSLKFLCTCNLFQSIILSTDQFCSQNGNCNRCLCPGS